MTVKYQDGTTQTVTVGTGTKIVKEVTGAASDLKAGQTIAIQGVSGTGDGQTPATIEIPLPPTSSP